MPAIDEAKQTISRYRLAHGDEMPSASWLVGLLRPALAADPDAPGAWHARGILAKCERALELEAVIAETAWATPEVLAAAEFECEVADGVVAVLEKAVATGDPRACLAEFLAGRS